MQKQSNCNLKKSAIRSTRAPEQSGSQGLARQRRSQAEARNVCLFCGPAHYATEEISFMAITAVFFARSASLVSGEHQLKQPARIVKNQIKKQIFKWDQESMGKTPRGVPSFQGQSNTPPRRDEVTIKKNDSKNDGPKVAIFANLPPKLKIYSEPSHELGRPVRGLSPGKDPLKIQGNQKRYSP
jgi:hypothetical protein